VLGWNPGEVIVTTEEAPYTVVEKQDAFEIRDYAPHVVAETVVEGEVEEAGNKAFNKLFRYISGANRTREKLAMTAPLEPRGEKIAMTAPVSQEPAGQKIAMTAPVGQRRVGERWAVSFMMPASYGLETLPVPLDPQVTLRQVPARRMAALRYSGAWNKKGYLRHKEELESWIQERELAVLGEPAWARYDAPFIPWFMRRNEILIPVDAGADPGHMASPRS